MSFTHLHVHSHYSLLDGLAKIDGLLQKAKSTGMSSLALTDHGVMYGALEFYQKAKELGIKPIIGVEAYVAKNGRKMKRPHLDVRPYHLILLAKNEIGYVNLIKLTSRAHLEGFYYKPRIDFDLFKKYSEGVIALSACVEGEIPRHILNNSPKKAEEAARRYEKLLGKGNFYLEIQDHPSLRKQIEVNEQLIEMSKKLDIPLVATNDSHYLNADDDKVHDVLMCIQMQRNVLEENRLSLLGLNLSLRSPQEMHQAFSYIPEALDNTNVIAEKCNLEIELGKTKLPYFPTPNESSYEDFIRLQCYKGLKTRYKIEENGGIPEGMDENIYKEIIERLEFELTIINKMGFPSYFLIVQDLVEWAKSNGVVVGPGRGSAAGCLVAYLLNITDIDPIKYKLLFERFLNPERISMPDIDLDFADIRRDEVIAYVKRKYGEKRVAQIITFGTMAAKAAVRDAGRALGYPYELCDRISKMIPMFTKLKEAVDTVPELKQEYEKDEQVKKLIDYSFKLEGVARHASTHACGTVISPEDIDNYMPIQYSTSGDNQIVTQYEMHGVETLGLLKMDFLGLKNLTIIENALKIISKVRHVDLDTRTFPLDDELTYKLFQDGGTTGVFQFESSGMKRYLRLLKPTEFEDLIAMVALYRPGPMDWIPDYIDGKHGKKKVEYLHPLLESSLSNTYGVAIYQEQIMQIARDLAGFTLGEADVLRKAVGKKIKELLAEQKRKFIDGCIANKIPKKAAEKIFAFIEPFAGYGFNRSHAACYALIAYQTAYLKAHYPSEFMASLLTADQENMDRVPIEISECDQMGIEVIAPDVNESFATFAVVPGTKNIRFALTAIKNLGHNIIEKLVDERKENGKYLDFDDFIKRMSSKDLNKRALESLAMSGALDGLMERKKVMANMDKILEFIRTSKKATESGQTDLFAISGASGTQDTTPKIKLENAEPATKKEKLAWEKELLGLYVSEHPIDDYKGFLETMGYTCRSIKSKKTGDQTKVGGVIATIKTILTKRGDKMLFVNLEDHTDKIEVIVFPTVLKENASMWEEGKVVLVEGKLNDRDGDMKMLCEAVKPLDGSHIAAWEASQKMATESRIRAVSERVAGLQESFVQDIDGSVKISVPAQASRELFTNIKIILESATGHQPVVLVVPDSNGQNKELKTSYSISLDGDIKNRINAEIIKFT